MKDLDKKTKIIINIAMVLLFGLLPILTTVVIAQEPALAGCNISMTPQSWRSLNMDWTEQLQTEWHEGDLVPTIFIVNNKGTSNCSTTDNVCIKFTFYNSSSSVNAIGFDFVRNFRYHYFNSDNWTASANSIYTPTWWQNNGFTFNPLEWNMPFPSGSGPDFSSPAADHYYNLGVWNIGAKASSTDTLVFYYDSHLASTVEWQLNPPCRPYPTSIIPSSYPQPVSMTGCYGSHNGASFFPGATVKMEKCTGGAKASSWNVPKNTGAITGHKYLTSTAPCNCTDNSTPSDNWTICLSGTMTDNRTVSGCKKTSGGGAYSFPNLNDETWHVWEQLNPGYTRACTNNNGTCSQTDNVSVTISGGNSRTVDFFNAPECTPPDCTISADDAVCENSTENTASAPDISGATYSWTIDNGSVDSGAGTYQITWSPTTDFTGTATLHVTVTVGDCSAILAGGQYPFTSATCSMVSSFSRTRVSKHAFNRCVGSILPPLSLPPLFSSGSLVILSRDMEPKQNCFLAYFLSPVPGAGFSPLSVSSART